MRQEGYYWVKLRGKRIVARWSNEIGTEYFKMYWYITGSSSTYIDSDFEEINENRIVYDTNTNR